MTEQNAHDVLWQSSGALSPLEARSLRREVLNARGRDLVFRTLFGHGTPEELAAEEEAREAERIYVAGGDGSVHLAVDALLRRDGSSVPEIAVLPRGTGNDFARALDLSADDWDLLVREVTGKQVSTCDVGSINGAFFVNAVTMGFGAEATRDLSPKLKQAAGGASYAAITTWKAFAADPFKAQLECRDERWSGEAMALIVLNGNTIGGGMEVGPDSRLDDGLLDIVLLPAFSAGELPEIVEDWFRRESSLFEHVRYFQTPWAELEVSRDLALSVDGEPSTGRVFSFCSRPRAVRFVRGAASSRA